MKAHLWVQDDTEHGYQIGSGDFQVIPMVGSLLSVPDKIMNSSREDYIVIAHEYHLDKTDLSNYEIKSVNIIIQKWSSD